MQSFVCVSVCPSVSLSVHLLVILKEFMDTFETKPFDQWHYFWAYMLPIDKGPHQLISGAKVKVTTATGLKSLWTHFKLYTF